MKTYITHILKRLSTLMALITAMLTVSIAVPAHAQDINWTGSGTQESPYEIDSQEKLAAIATQGLDKHYKLTTSFTVDSWATSIDNFTGTFDGDGYVITMSNAAASLFKTIKAGGTVKNLGVKVTITITSNGNSYGGIAMTNYGTIQQCYTVGSIEGGNTYAGGIVGTNDAGTVQDCYSTVAITVKQGAGGIAQVNKNGGTVERCYATGAITGGGNDGVGGIAGDNASGSKITQCIALNASITHAAGSNNSGRITGTSSGKTLSGNYASPLIVGSWNSGLAEKDGAKLTDKNFIDTGSGASAFTDWLPAVWDFGDNSNLPSLKTTEGNAIGGQGTMPTRYSILGIIEISAPVTYDAEKHKDKNIMIRPTGTFIVNTDAASLEKLTIDEGGQVVANAAFT